MSGYPPCELVQYRGRKCAQTYVQNHLYPDGVDDKFTEVTSLHTLYLSTIVTASPSLYLTICCLHEMQSRFTNHHQTALLGLSIVPSILVKLSDEEFSATVLKFADSYTGDLPSADCIHSELHFWQLKWKQ